jgi:hypothetical protein
VDDLSRSSTVGRLQFATEVTDEIRGAIDSPTRDFAANRSAWAVAKRITIAIIHVY